MKENEAKLAAAFGQIKGVNVDESAIRAHVMRPQHLVGALSDRGNCILTIIQCIASLFYGSACDNRINTCGWIPDAPPMA
jgi:hypothetical protein